MKKKDENNIVRNDDYDYEMELLKHEKQLEQEKKRLEEEHQKKLRQQEKAREKRLNEDKIELIKLKNGIIEESETIKEEHEPKIELHGWAKVSNFFYHNKMIIIFISFFVIIFGIVAVDSIKQKQPDYMIFMIADNGLEFRSDELEKYIAEFADDANNDGEVVVSVVSCPLREGATDQEAIANQSKFFGQLQTAQNIFVIADQKIDQDLRDNLSDVTKDFKGYDCVTKDGISFDSDYMHKVCNYKNMPDGVFLAMRTPIRTMNDKLETMQKNYDKAYKVFAKIAEDINNNKDYKMKDEDFTNSSNSTLQ